MIKQYKMVILISLITIVVYAASVELSNEYFEYKDSIEYEQFNDGHAFYAPYENNLPWDINVVYNGIYSLHPKNNLILMGASTTRGGIIPDEFILPENWKVTNLAIGASTVDSFRLMRNYINGYAEHKPDKSDVVVMHIFHASFVKIPLEEDPLYHVIADSGVYSIDDSLQVHGSMSNLRKHWVLNNFKISSVLGLSKGSVGESLYFRIQNIVTNVFSTSINDYNGENNLVNAPSNIAKYKDHWVVYTKNTSYPSEQTEHFKKIVNELNKQSNVVIVNLYVPSWHSEYPSEQEYKKWLETDLVPYLNEKDIPWIDLSESIPDDEYGDSAHLFKEGRSNYTRQFGKAMNPILSEL